jgi:hypothetical protein
MKHEWDNFLTNSKNSSFLFYRDYMEYHQDRFTDYSLVVTNEKNQFLAIFPANITSDNVVISHQGLTYGGLVVKEDEKLVDVILFIKEILKFLQNHHVDTLIYKEIPAIYNKIPSEEVLYALFILEANLIRRDACTAIRTSNRLSYQRRRSSAIKNAQRLNVRIEGDNNFEAFWNQILVPNLTIRHGIKPVHTLNEIKLLHSRFPRNIKQYNAYLGDEIMAGATVFETSDIARAQYTSGSIEGRKNGSLDLLFDKLINQFYADKAYIDFGNSNDNNGLIVNFGLLDWKEGLGARSYAQNFYEIKTHKYYLLDKLLFE